MIGELLSHFRILERLGEGGMGVVYRARDERLDRDVALKLMPEGTLGDTDARARFRREAIALSRLSHASIATLFDLERVGDNDVLVMEFVAGETLERHLANGALPEAEIVALALQIASALEAAHEQGVIHRDLKPGNVMVTPRGLIKVLDFGVAKMQRRPTDGTSGVTAPQQLIGTLAYMSPEQLLEIELDPRADIWSLGVVLYRMATGKLPFEGTSSVALANRIINEAAEPPSRHRANLSSGLETLILRCLAKRAADRPGSAAEVIQMLHALESGAPITAAAAAPSHLECVAVLPLENLSGDPAQEYFADGMTEALIHDLARIGELRVISRTSVMQYKGARRPLPEIARSLKVDAVVEGTVMRSGERVRITAHLIEATSDRSLWTNSYERDMGDVLSLQTDVARAIANEVRGRLRIGAGRADRVGAWTGDTAVSRTPTGPPRVVQRLNPQAYEAYLRGRFFLNRRTREGFDKAIPLFQRAIELDPRYAAAWSGLADTYNLLGAYRMRRPVEVFPLAKEAAARSLELDPDSAEGHASLGMALQDYDWEWEAAAYEYHRAIALNPSYTTAHNWYADHLSALGRHEEAIEEGRIAVGLDPLSPVILAVLSEALFFARRYDESIIQLRSIIELDASYQRAHMDLGRALVEKGLYEEAIESYTRGHALTGDRLDESTAIAHARARMGDRAHAEAVIARLEEASAKRHVSPYPLAVIRTALGDIDRAFGLLDRAFEERDRMLVMMKVHPRLDPLRSDPRFDVMLSRVGLAR